jgi:3-phenylpropionate/trans-cinnamate dioxygenase ferredoxin subunit
MWVQACALDDIDPEDLIRWDHDGRTYAIYRDEDGAVFATDGLCTHENVHLCDGLVIGNQVECPKHNGRFDYKTGEAKRLPCVTRLQTWPARIVGGRVEIDL